jgi:hypothetical protein
LAQHTGTGNNTPHDHKNGKWPLNIPTYSIPKFYQIGIWDRQIYIQSGSPEFKFQSCRRYVDIAFLESNLGSGFYITCVPRWAT